MTNQIRNQNDEASAVSGLGYSGLVRHSGFWFLVCLIAVVVATAIFPGDTPWIADEPLLIHGALQFNSTPSHIGKLHFSFTPAPSGLIGTRGATYGPLAVWIDQIFLGFTHNPVVMVCIRSILFSAITAVSLWWLAKSLGASRWLALTIMLSPWMWFYSRQLWDNSLCVPACAMLLASYADFVLTHRRWSLRLCVICGVLLLLIHFMAVPLIAAIALHAVVFEFRSLWRFKWSILIIAAISLGLSWRYWTALPSSYHPTIPGGTSAIAGYFFPLLGPHHLSAAGLGNFLGDAWAAPEIPVLVTLIVYPVIWIAILLAIPALVRVVLRWPRATPVDHVLAIAWAAVIFQCILGGIEHIYGGPHYLNSIWIVFAAFLFFGARRARPWMIAIYAVALLLVTASIAVAIHENAGLRSANFGTALSDQIAAVRDIQKFSADSPIHMDFPQWHDHPIELQTLWQLFPPPKTRRTRRTLEIRYRRMNGPDAHIAVIPAE